MTGMAVNGDVKIAYEEFGTPDGAPLLLIMGVSFQMVWWPDEFCELLAQRGFHVARFDNRDTGLSTRYAGNKYTAQDMSDDAVAVMDALGWASAHIVGGSLGATIAQVVAIRRPERVRSLTCLMSGGVGSPWNTLRNVRFGTVVKLAGRRYPAGLEGDIQSQVDTFRVMSSPGHPFEEEWGRRVARVSAERGVDRRAARRQVAAGRTAGDLRGELRRLTIPALVIHGRDDPLIRPRAGRQLAAAIPGARFVEYPAMGHEMPRHLFGSIVDEIHGLTKAGG
jgi:pimeloyl-ACP methyl ester carboxylesterase